MTPILRDDLKLKYYLGLHNLHLTKYSILFDICEYLVKKNKKDLSAFKFSPKTLKYIFGDRINDDSFKIKIVSFIRELSKDEYLFKKEDSIFITKKGITRYYNIYD
jgi:hypothetical protein